MAKNNNDLSTIISAGTEVVGDVSFRGHLQIDGTIFGNLIADDKSKASVTISERGRVNGEISVPTVTVSGHVSGDVHACEHLVINATANIKGSMFCNFIEVEGGSVIEGHMESIYRGLPEECPAMPKRVTQSTRTVERVSFSSPAEKD